MTFTVKNDQKRFNPHHKPIKIPPIMYHNWCVLVTHTHRVTRIHIHIYRITHTKKTKVFSLTMSLYVVIHSMILVPRSDLGILLCTFLRCSFPLQCCETVPFTDPTFEQQGPHYNWPKTTDKKCPSNSCSLIVIVLTLTSFNHAPCFLRLFMRPS